MQSLVLNRHHRVARIIPCPDFVFTIKEVPILITDDIFEMACAITTP
jgi:hypothetical protein